MATKVPLPKFLTRPEGPFSKRNLGKHKARNKTRGLLFTPVTDEQFLDLVRAGFRVVSKKRGVRVLR